MAKRVGTHFRRNVVGYLALFVALGMGTAYALDRNSVKSKHIAPGAVKLSDTNDKLRLKCPGNMRYHEGACIERDVRDAANWSAARGDCLDEGKRLPGLSELLSFAAEPGVTLQNELTEHVWSDNGGLRTLAVNDQGGWSDQATSAAAPYRCAASPKR